MTREQRLEAFSNALSTAIKRSGKRKAQISREVTRLGVDLSESSLAAYAKGEYLPKTVEPVWALEAVLDCDGELTGPLGYRPETTSTARLAALMLERLDPHNLPEPVLEYLEDLVEIEQTHGPGTVDRLIRSAGHTRLSLAADSSSSEPTRPPREERARPSDTTPDDELQR